jgi:hypothetical protein
MGTEKVEESKNRPLSCPWCGSTNTEPLSGEVGECYRRCAQCRNFVPVDTQKRLEAEIERLRSKLAAIEAARIRTDKEDALER